MKNIMKKKNVLVILAILALVSNISSATLVADPQQPLSSNSTYVVTPGNFFAQTFTSAQNYLFKFDYYTYAGPSTLHNYDVKVEIFGSSVNYPAPSSASLTRLAEKRVTISSPSAGAQYYTFDFSDSPIDIRNYNSSVGAGRLMFKITLMSLLDPGNRLYCYYNAGVTTYPQGEFFVNSDNRINGDMRFIAWTSAVPEPATVMLLGLGSAFLLKRKHRG